MKLVCIFFLMLSLVAPAQTKPVSKIKAKTESIAAKPPVEGFIITGMVTGFDDGTPVSFLNDQTGQPEQQTTIQGGKFSIKGKMDQPGFKALIFANAQPLIPLFIDNSAIKIEGNKDGLDKLVIT